MNHIILFGHAVSVPLFITTVTAGVLLLIWNIYSQWKKKLPPGPWGWPVLGCTHLLSPDFYLKVTDLGRIYGDVFSFYIGNRLTIVLNSSRAIREAFLNQGVTFAGRPHPWVMQLVEVKEIINNGTYTDEWKEERKFVLNAMRQFGYGSSSLSEKISNEVDTLLEVYASSAASKTPLNPRTHMPKTMANLIFSILINESYEYNDKKLIEKLDLISRWQRSVGEANQLDVFPLLRFIPWEPMRKLRKVRDEIVAMYRKHVVEHKETFDQNQCRDVVDVYLKERGLDFDEDRIVGLFFSFAGDAVDSLPEVMVWMVLYICSDPRVQKKLQEEIDQATGGGSRQINFDDRPEMPFTEAVIMETLRLSTFVPLSELHWTLDDTKLFGYDIPKDCAVLGNIYASHIDPQEWETPLEFKPERFLDASGNVLKPKAFMPYSVGRRECLGEQLSNKVLFLFLTRLLATFTLTFADPGSPPDLKAERWYNRKSQEFAVRVFER